jgi:hypothetical protein
VKITFKADKSPVTDGDLAVDELLRTIGNLKLRYKDAAIYEALCWELLTNYKRLKSCERKRIIHNWFNR